MPLVYGNVRAWVIGSTMRKEKGAAAAAPVAENAVAS